MTTMSRAARMVGAPLLVMTIVACSGTAGSSPPAAGASEPVSGAPSASAEGSAGPVDAAAQRFQVFSDGLLQATEDLNRALSGTPTDEALTQAYTTYAALLDQAADEVGALELPAETQADVATIQEQIATLSAEFEELAANPTVEWGPEIEAALAELTAAVGRIRASLGLPPAM